MRPDLDHLRDVLPLRMGRVELDILLDEPTEVAHANPDEVWATVRVIHYEDNGWVRDIMQQDVRLAPHPNLLADVERVRSCLEAHGEVLTELFARPRDPYASSDFPADLLFMNDLLTLRTASTREQFVAALRARKRLGKRLGV